MSDNDNGKKEEAKQEPKTSEQLKQERLERYTKEPEKFIEITELVVGAIRTSVGIGVATYVGNGKRTELDIATMELNHAVSRRMMSMDVEQEMKNATAKGLITPDKKGGIIDFARGGFKK